MSLGAVTAFVVFGLSLFFCVRAPPRAAVVGPAHPVGGPAHPRRWLRIRVGLPITLRVSVAALLPLCNVTAFVVVGLSLFLCVRASRPAHVSIASPVSESQLSRAQATKRT